MKLNKMIIMVILSLLIVSNVFGLSFHKVQDLDSANDGVSYYYVNKTYLTSTETNSNYLAIDGSNANSNIDIGNYNLTSEGIYSNQINATSLGTIGSITNPNWAGSAFYLEDSLANKLGMDGNQFVSDVTTDNFFFQNANTGFTWETNGETTDRMTLDNSGLEINDADITVNNGIIQMDDDQLLKFGELDSKVGNGGRIQIQVDVPTIDGLQFKNSNAEGQVRFVVKDNLNNYMVMNSVGSNYNSAQSWLETPRQDGFWLWAYSQYDTDKILGIGTINAGDVILGAYDKEYIRLGADEDEILINKDTDFQNNALLNIDWDNSDIPDTDDTNYKTIGNISYFDEYIPDKEGELVLDGISDYVDVGDTDQSFGAVSFWFKPNTTFDYNSVAQVPIDFIPYNPEYFKISFGLSTGLLTNEVITIMNKEPDSQNYRTGYCGTGINLNATWHHLVVVHEGGTTNYAIYLDGTRVDNCYSNSGVPVREMSAVKIGKSDSSSTANFDGSLDEIMIFNDTITSTDVTTLYNLNRSDYTGSTNNLVSHYNFDDTPNDFKDSQESNDGTGFYNAYTNAIVGKDGTNTGIYLDAQTANFTGVPITLINNETKVSIENDGFGNLKINVTDGTLKIYNNTGWGTIEYGNAIEHTYLTNLTDEEAYKLVQFASDNFDNDGITNYTAWGECYYIDEEATDFSRPVVKEYCSEEIMEYNDKNCSIQNVCKYAEQEVCGLEEQDLIEECVGEAENKVCNLIPQEPMEGCKSEEICNYVDEEVCTYTPKNTTETVCRESIDYPFIKIEEGVNVGCKQTMIQKADNYERKAIKIYDDTVDINSNLLANNIYFKSKAVSPDTDYTSIFSDATPFLTKHASKYAESITLDTGNIQQVDDVEEQIKDLQGYILQNEFCRNNNKKWEDYNLCMDNGETLGDKLK